MQPLVSAVAFAGVMSALDGDVAMTNNRLENLSLLAPEKLAESIAHPANRIRDVRVLGWVEQISERLPHRITSLTHSALTNALRLHHRYSLLGQRSNERHINALLSLSVEQQDRDALPADG